MIDGGYLTLNERRAYRDGAGRVQDERRMSNLQGVMRTVREASKHALAAQRSTLLGAESHSAREFAAYAAGAIDAALSIVQRVRV